MSSFGITFTVPQSFPITREICREQANDPKWDVKSLEIDRVVLTERSGFFSESFPAELHLVITAKADAAEVQIYASNSGLGPIQASHIRTVVKEFEQKIRQAARESPILVEAPYAMSAEISKLQELRDGGILSSSQFERAKETYLGLPTDKVQQMMRNLLDLWVLYQRGVITKIEFEIKKRDILART